MCKIRMPRAFGESLKFSPVPCRHARGLASAQSVHRSASADADDHHASAVARMPARDLHWPQDQGVESGSPVLPVRWLGRHTASPTSSSRAVQAVYGSTAAGSAVVEAEARSRGDHGTALEARLGEAAAAVMLEDQTGGQTMGSKHDASFAAAEVADSCSGVDGESDRSHLSMALAAAARDHGTEHQKGEAGPCAVATA